MTSNNYSLEDVPSRFINLGGRGLTSKLIVEEVAPSSEPLGKNNKIVLAPGLLTGTLAPSSGRISIGAKSPLTGGIKESNAGGTASHYLAGHGIKAVIIEGKPADDNSWVIVINGKEVKFEKMNELAGLGNYETVDRLKKEFGSQCSVISIGPAGEQEYLVATIAVSDLESRPTRHAARGGLGAVMGSKGIKAIVISQPQRSSVKITDIERFKQTSKEFSKALIESKKALTKYGTALLVNVVNEVGGLPTRNFSVGYNEKAKEISGEKLKELCDERGGATGHPCSRGCVIRCSNVYHDAKGNYITAGFEFETIGLLGSNCDLNDLDCIAQLDYLCDDIGVDTIDIGVGLGIAMEAGMIRFGDYLAMREVILSITNGTNLLGRLIGHGAAITGKILGVKRIPTVKGQAISSYDPRALKGTGVTYSTSPMGADHTAGNALPGRGGLDCHKPEGQIELSRNLQIMSMVCDIMGICVFVGPIPENMPIIADLVSFMTGTLISVDELLDQAEEALGYEMDYNFLAGFSKEENDLPEFFRNEALPNNQMVFDVKQDDLLEFQFEKLVEESI